QDDLRIDDLYYQCTEDRPNLNQEHECRYFVPLHQQPNCQYPGYKLQLHHVETSTYHTQNHQKNSPSGYSRLRRDQFLSIWYDCLARWRKWQSFGEGIVL